MKSSRNSVFMTVAIAAIYCLTLFNPGVQAQVEGTSCTDPSDCKPADTFLDCVGTAPDGVCKCPSSSYFETDKCRLIAGEQCTNDPGVIQCPVNGWCNTTLSSPWPCVCLPPAVETLTNRCAVPHGDPCTENSLCNSEGFVLCLADAPRTCGCEPDRSNYDAATEHCLLKLEATCDDPASIGAHQKCAVGTECTDEGTGFKCHCLAGSSDNGQGQCRANEGQICDANILCNEANYLTCETNVCKCRMDMIPDKKGGCWGDFNAACDKQEPCDDSRFLECNEDGKCDCRNDLENTGDLCTAKFGESCAGNVPCNDKKWVDCINDTCTCDIAAHMIPDGSGGCWGDFDATCVNGEPCDISRLLKCGENDKCDCRSGLEHTGDKCTAKFGESCAGNVPCNVDNWVECLDDFCTCNPQMDADGQEGCEGKLNAPCDKGQPCDFDNFLICKDQTTCECKNQMEADSAGKCQSQYDGPCGVDPTSEHCDELKFLVCDTDKCKCRTDLADVDGKCFAKYNQSCNIPGEPNCDVASNLVCNSTQNQCECTGTSTPVGDGKCGANMGADCESNDDCAESMFLVCKEKKCDCKEGFDAVGHECKGRFGTACTGNECNTDNFLDCGLLSRVCECRIGLVDLGAGECRALFGGACAVDGVDQPECHSAEYLTCSDGTCECSDPVLTPVVDKNVCRADLGVSCAIGIDACNEAQFTVCGADKICACRPDLNNIGNKCTSGFGGTCEHEEPCDEFLDCVDKKCRCHEDYIDIGRGECKSLYNQECKVDGHPDCDPKNYITCDALTKKCVCQPGLGLSANGHGGCRLPMEANCSPTGPPCDETNFEFCGTESKVCECTAGSIFIGTICKAQFNESCTQGQPCVDESHACSPADGRCHCRSGLNDIGKGVCRSLFGGSCASGQPPCDGDNNLVCGRNETCVCQLDLIPNADGKCRANFGDKCDATRPCDDHLVCNAAVMTCQCKAGLIDLGGGECRARIGGDCSDNVPCDETKMLECGSDNKCRCKLGLVDFNDDGDCKAPLGSACTDDTLCDDKNFMKCGDHGKCICMEGFLANLESQCRVPANGTCSPEQKCDETSFLVCKGTTCGCANNLTLSSSDLICRAHFGDSCANGERCDELERLHCGDDKTCVCLPGMRNLRNDGYCSDGGKLSLSFTTITGLVTLLTSVCKFMA